MTDDDDSDFSSLGARPDLEQQFVSLLRQLRKADIDPEWAFQDAMRHLETYGPPRPRAPGSHPPTLGSYNVGHKDWAAALGGESNLFRWCMERSS